MGIKSNYSHNNGLTMVQHLQKFIIKKRKQANQQKTILKEYKDLNTTRRNVTN